MSPVIDSLLDRMSGVGAVASDFWGVLGAEVFIRGIDLAIDRVRALTSALNDAAAIETQQIAAASDIATNLGISMEQSRAIVNDTAKQIAAVAAALPGETQGYNEIFNAISGTVADRIKDPEEFQRVAIDLTKRIGALAAIRGQSTADAGSQAMRLLAGTVGYGEARASFDFLQKNPMLQRAIEAQAAQLGTSVDQRKKMSADVRMEIFTKALEQASPDQLFDAFKGTAEDYIQTLRTRFFDPTIGIFGVMREVSSRGNRTVLDAAKGSLGAFSELLDSLAALDWAFDPLAGLIDLFDGLTRFMDGISGALAGIGGTGGFPALGSITGASIIAFGEGIRDTLITGIQRFGAVFNSINWGNVASVFSGIVVGLAKMAGSIPHYLTRVVEAVDWVAVGDALGQFAVYAFVNIGAWLWEYVPRFVTGLIRLALTLLGAAATLAFGGLRGVLRQAFTQIADDFLSVIKLVLSPFEAIRSGIESVARRLGDFFSNILSTFSNIGNGIRSFGANTIGRIPGLGGAFRDPAATDGSGNSTTVAPVPSPASPVTAQPVPMAATPNSQTRVNTFAPTVNVPVSGSADPGEIATAVMDRINSLYRQHTEAQLA